MSTRRARRGGATRARSASRAKRSAGATSVLVTGATDGLGRAVAQRLAGEGATLLLHGRDRARLDAVGRELGAAQTFLADFSSLEEVRAMAADVGELDVLVNNAGIGSGKPDRTTRQESRDGYELRFAVNYLAPFLLTQLLLGRLRRPGRIVPVASLGQAPIDFDDPMIEHGYGGARAYSQSKLAQITSGFELASRLPAEEVTVNSLHPATYMPTKIVLEQAGRSVDTLETGVDAVVRLATAPELAGVTGRFYDRQAEAEADPQAYDAAARRRLWALSLELTGAPDA